MNILISKGIADEYVHLQKEIDKSWKKLKKDIENHADKKTLQKDYNEFLLLLGEINFITKECYRLQKKGKETDSYLL